jgi:hypothetical protein
MSVPGSAAPPPDAQSGVSRGVPQPPSMKLPLYNEPPSWPRPDQFGRATYPGGHVLAQSTDPRIRVLMGPKGEPIANYSADQSPSADEVASKYQKYNEGQLQKRLFQNDPIAVAGLSPGRTIDLNKPLPPPQQPTPESMTAAKALRIKLGMESPDEAPTSSYDRLLANERDPRVRQAIINQQGLSQRAQAANQQKAEAAAMANLSKQQQQVAITARSKYTQGLPLLDNEQATLELLAQHTRRALEAQGGQQGAPQQGQAPAASSATRKTINGVTYVWDGRGWTAQ